MAKKPVGCSVPDLPPLPKGRAAWAVNVSEAYDKSRHWFFETGRRLAAAKGDLEHGEFLKMIEGDLPFGKRRAQDFMKIAAFEPFSKAQDPALLPGSAEALLALTRLPAAVYAKADKEGAIKADMKAPDVKRFYKTERRAAAAAERANFDGGTAQDLIALAKTGFRARAVLADVPWQYETWSDKGQDRAPPYPTMSIEALCDPAFAGAIEAVCAEDCVLFFWGVDWAVVEADVVTAFGDYPGTVLPAAGVVMRAWGFRYVTKAFAWTKQKPKEEGGGLHRGTGKWTMANTEDCWLGKRGSPSPLSVPDSLIVHPVMEHSRKPAEIHDRIEAAVAGPYLELFARRERKGWLTWGNDVPAPKGPDKGGK